MMEEHWPYIDVISKGARYVFTGAVVGFAGWGCWRLWRSRK